MSSEPAPPSDKKKRSVILSPGFWVVFAVFLGAMVATVKPGHTHAVAYMGIFAGLSAFCLGVAVWVRFRGASEGGGDDSALRAAFDENPDGILVTDPEGAFVYSNPAFHALCSFAAGGGASRRVESMAAVALALEGENADNLKRLAQSASDGAGGHTEFSIDRPGGAVEWRRVGVVPLAGKRGVRTGALWRVEDVTILRELDGIRRDEEGRTADMLDMLPVGFFSADRTGVIEYANQTLSRWLGVSPDRLAGRPFADFVADVGDGEDLVLRDSQGRTFPVALEQSQLDAEDGDVAYTRSVVFRDIVWREPVPVEEAEEADEPSPPEPETAAPVQTVVGDADPGTGRMRWLFDDAPIGIVLLDLEGVVSDCNRAFSRLTGLHRDAVAGVPFVEHLAKEDRGDLAAGLSKMVMGTSRGIQMEVRLPVSGEREITCALYANRREDGGGEITGLVAYLIDVTEHRNLEVQFTQSQKMQAVGQLAGGMAHDFNNLLTAMIGFCDLLLTRHGPDDPSFADIQQIRQNANRATNLVRQLLAFSRKQTLTPEEMDVTEALSDLSNLLRRLIGETVELILEHGDDLPAVKADRGQFDQVVINLTVNARDAMPGGGAVTLRSSRAVLEAPVQRGHDLMPAGTYALLEVMETGVGISKENLERIFEPFFSTKEVGVGTGLGLSTVYGIVHQSGGFIFVDSAPGEGTTFSIYLPEYVPESLGVEAEAEAAAEKEAQAAREALVAGDLTGRGTVLLVEDEDAVRMFGARALKNKGYTVLEADNGEHALDVINSTDETIDLIVSDVIMPGMDGHTLVNLVRQEIPDVKVILMSGYAEDTFREEIGRDTSVNFLGKPFTLKDLAGKVKEVLDGAGPA